MQIGLVCGGRRLLFIPLMFLVLLTITDMLKGDIIRLPSVKTRGEISVEEAIYHRRSRREFEDKHLTLFHLSQILWAGQGISSKAGFRTVPSAGATYPLVLYVAVGKVEDLACGLYRYTPQQHSLIPLLREDIRQELAREAWGQTMIAKAAVDIIIAANFQRTTSRYGSRGRRYVYMEAGHSSENIYLECESLGLATCAVGAFNDERVKNILRIEEEPLYIMPVGLKRGSSCGDR